MMGLGIIELLLVTVLGIGGLAVVVLSIIAIWKIFTMARDVEEIKRMVEELRRAK